MHKHTPLPRFTAPHPALGLTLTFAMVLAATTTGLGCKGKDGGSGGNGAKSGTAGSGAEDTAAEAKFDQETLAKYADAAEAHFTKQKGTFLKTEYMVYCRSGNLLAKSKLGELGFAPPKDNQSRTYCYNVADNLKKVALSVGDATGENVLCLVLDGSGGKVSRGKPTRTSRCQP